MTGRACQPERVLTMTMIDAAQIVHLGLVLTWTDSDGREKEGPVQAIVMHPTTGKPDLVVIEVDGKRITLPLEGMIIDKHWTVH